METWIAEVTGARSARRGERLASLWSGYGEIVRVHLEAGPAATVVLKRVAPPTTRAHPRGWGTDRSHARKLRSYAVEAAFYRGFAARSRARVPALHAARDAAGQWNFVLEDLDAAGFPERRRTASHDDVDGCLAWLAAFHASFLGEAPEGLWAEGTYWHLATRPDELAAMAPGPLRDAAAALDEALVRCPFRTLVHGDAKLANFCFGPAGVAALDFQYVGGGCGMKDVAYLFSCLDTATLERHAAGYLDRYFAHLRTALDDTAHDAGAVEAVWRPLLPLAFADFERFLAGWAPEHPKRDAYAAAMTEQALRSCWNASKAER
ncbi:MAG: phosphotransferase [Myxococcota bacterium]